MEPRAPSPERRLATIRRLADAGIPTGVMVAPVIPLLTEHELEAILARAAAVGAKSARYGLLRLPLEVKALFFEWLQIHFPTLAAPIRKRLRDLHQGREYDSRFGQRMRGSGVHADLLAKRFALARRRHGLQNEQALDTSQFRFSSSALRRPPHPAQLNLL